MTRIRTALVIGGGIAGPVAAMALRKAGITATVHEAYAEPSDGVGAGLSIAANGLDALAVVGLADAVRAIGVPMRSIVLESCDGRRLGEFGAPPGLPSTQFVWRADLYRVLREAAASHGVAPSYGKRLVSVQEHADGIGVTFADGTQAEADILIGADGIRSLVRTLIDPGAPSPRYAGLLGFGGRVPDTGLESTQGAMHMSFGRRAFLGYQVYDDGSGGWFVNLPRREPMSTAQAREVDGAEWMRQIARAFARDRNPGQRLFARTDPAELMITGPVESIGRVPRWHRGRMVLIGDAAHATSPSSGQGASLAVESATQLARCLRDLPHDRAFAAYERLRRARVERIMTIAARTNKNKAAGPLGRLVRDAVLPLAMRFAKPERMAWQFEHHVDWEAPVVDVPAAAPVPTS